MYRLDGLSAATTNGVTVLPCTAGGRYLLMYNNVITAKQAGAVGDGIADDYLPLQNLLDACPNIVAKLDPLPYLSTTGLVLPNNTTVIAYGATLTVETTGEDRAVDMGSWCTWKGGTIIDAYQSGGTGSSNDHCPVRFGDYTGVANYGVSNSVLREVTLDVSGSYATVSVLVTQGSENITIDTVEVLASATLDAAILMHWGFVDAGDVTQGTRHPHNVKVHNINVGSLSQQHMILMLLTYPVYVLGLRFNRLLATTASTTAAFHSLLWVLLVLRMLPVCTAIYMVPLLSRLTRMILRSTL